MEELDGDPAPAFSLVSPTPLQPTGEKINEQRTLSSSLPLTAANWKLNELVCALSNSAFQIHEILSWGAEGYVSVDHLMGHSEHKTTPVGLVGKTHSSLLMRTLGRSR